MQVPCLQVTDTPGLLNRAAEDRNAMERLTLACMAHLPTCVLFVMDLTGQCGTSVAAQWDIRADLKSLFPAKAWLDVFTKADLLADLQEQVALDRAAPVLGSGQHSDLDSLSALAAPAVGAGAGKEQHVSNGLPLEHQSSPIAGDSLHSSGTLSRESTEAQSVSDDSAGRQQISVEQADRSTQSEQGQRPRFKWGDRADVDKEKALEVARALPEAVWVSSLSEIGLDTLKESVLQLLSQDE